MSAWKISGVVVVAMAVVACGGKDKKEDTVPPAPVVEQPAAEPAEEPTAAEPADEPDPASLTEVLYFEFDSSDLSGQAKEILANNAEWLKADKSRQLTIEGHTDEVGTTDYNIALGERRARAAQDYLVRLGVDKGRVRVISYGEEKPAGSDDSMNRRSMFISGKPR